MRIETGDARKKRVGALIQKEVFMLLREYETIYILKPDITDENITQVNQRLMNVFDQDGGHVLKQNTWGKKKLAFEMRKQQKGIYVHLHYLGKPTMIKELERNLRMLEPVLAYQTIKLASDVDVEQRLAQREQEKTSQAAPQDQSDGTSSEKSAHQNWEGENEAEEDLNGGDSPEGEDGDDQDPSSDQDS